MVRLLTLILLFVVINMCDSLNIFGTGSNINAGNTPCPKLGAPTLTSEIQTIDVCMG